MNKSFFAASVANATLWSKGNYEFIKRYYGDPPDWEKYYRDIAEDMKGIVDFDVNGLVSLMKKIFGYHKSIL